MEYLLTYGWAILIVIAVGAVLSLYGVFSPISFLGAATSGFTKVAVLQFEVNSTGGVKMQLDNRVGDTITVVNFTVDGNGIWNGTTIGLPVVMAPGNRTFVSGVVNTSAGITGSSYSSTVRILFIDAGVNLTSVGSLTGLRT